MEVAVGMFKKDENLEKTDQKENLVTSSSSGTCQDSSCRLLGLRARVIRERNNSVI